MGTTTIGSGLTIAGTGAILKNNGVLSNGGTINANIGGGTLTIDALGTSSGLAGSGVGTSNNAGLYNTGTIATGGGSIVINGGLYENGDTGVLAADNGNLSMTGGGGAALVNLSAAGVLSKGTYRAAGGSTLTLRGNGSTNGITAIGTAGSGTDTTVTLSGTGAISAGSSAGTTLGALTGTLTSIGATGKLELLAGNSFTSGVTTLTNNGIVSIGANSTYVSSVNQSIAGSGQFVLIDATAMSFSGGTTTIGSGITVTGTGNLLGATGRLINNGTITGVNLVIDPLGGSAAAVGGVGSEGTAAFYNTGTLTTTASGTLALQGGRYENSATGVISAQTGGSVVMISDADPSLASTLVNFSTNVLAGGSYQAFGTGSITLRGGTGVINTIGGSGATDTVVTLSGASSVLRAGTSSAAATTDIAASLTRINYGGRLELLQGRSFNSAANLIRNYGIVQLGGAAGAAAGTFTVGQLDNYGTLFGYGNVAANIYNYGTVRASNGTLAVKYIFNDRGGSAVIVDAGATLDIATISTADSRTGFLTNNGVIDLGTRTMTVRDDYQNAAFGTGNAFAARANVTGTGAINAVSATQALSATGLSGGTLAFGNMRVGGSATQTLTITNNGTATILRGAVQNTNAAGVALTTPDFVLAANGGTATTGISVGSVAGDLAGQTLTVANNFTNVGNATIALTGKVYAPAVASLGTTSVAFGATRVGTNVSRTVSVTNTATGALIDSLITVATAPPGMVLTGPGLLAGGAGGVATLTLGSTAGTYSGNLAFNFSSHDADLADLALASQSVSYSGKVYAPAVATLGATSVDFGAVRVGGGDHADDRPDQHPDRRADRHAADAEQPAAELQWQRTRATCRRGIGHCRLHAEHRRCRGDRGRCRPAVHQPRRRPRRSRARDADRRADRPRLCQGHRKRERQRPRLRSDARRDERHAQRADHQRGDRRADRLAEQPAAELQWQRTRATCRRGIGHCATSVDFGFTLNTAVAGVIAGDADLLFTSRDADLADLALATQTVALTGKVYAPAIATLGATSVDFGAVRVGGSAITRTVSLTNSATGALTDTLVTQNDLPPGFNGSAPGPLAAGGTGSVGFTLNPTVAGIFAGNAELRFTSHDADLADLALATQTVALTGTVTELASASLFKAGGQGALTGGGTSYTLDFGRFYAGTSVLTADLGVLNAILASAYGETLGGTFSGGDTNGFSFTGGSFAGLGGGATRTGATLSFAQTGLIAGTYTTAIDLAAFSRYLGLPDYTLAHIMIFGKATIVPTGGIVPNPRSGRS